MYSLTYNFYASKKCPGLAGRLNSCLHLKSVKDSKLSRSDCPGKLFPKNRMMIIKCAKYNPIVPLGLVYAMVVVFFMFQTSSIAGGGFQDIREERRFIMITLN